MLDIFFHYFVFPGFVFLACAGMLVSWIDRKVTARLQWRVGPPLLQPFYDLRKLLYKEIIVPADGNRYLFVIAPFIGVVSAMLIADILLLTWADPARGFVGDLIVILYLFMLAPVAGILGASASHNPMASIGASREMKLVLSYELPFILSLMVPVIKTRSILLGNIVAAQQSGGPVAGSVSGIIALLVAIFCLHGKLGLVPFDISDAETELSAGVLIEYSGPLLGLWKLGKMMFMVIGPLFLAIVFWSGGGTLALLLKYAALLAAAILIRNTNPRLRIDQAMRFFWGPAALASVAALALALNGW